MIKIEKNRLKQIIKDIPEEVGLFICYNGTEPVFFKITENLAKFIDYYLIADTEDEDLNQLRKGYDTIEFIPSSDLLTCLLEEKLFFQKNRPVFNRLLKEYEYYSYLSVQWEHVPYLESSNDTLKENIYIGPFRDAFFVQDIIDTFADIYKLPSCEGENYPCEKLEAQLCAGFCMLGEEKDLQTVLVNYIISPNLAVLQDLKQRIQQSEDDLDFNSSDILQTQYKLISNYYRQLLFFFITRHLDYEDEHHGTPFSVKNGLVKSITLKNGYKEEFFKEDLPRTNELLAVNKDELNERWIIFRTLEEKKPDFIKELFHKQFQLTLKEILNNIKTEEEK